MILRLFFLFNGISKNYSFKVNQLSIVLLAYWFVYLLTSLSAIASTASFYSDFNRMDGFVAYSFFCLFYVVYSHEKFSNQQWQLIGKVSCIIAFLIAILAIFQNNFGGEYRAMGTLANPLTLAIYLIFHIFLGLNFILNKNNFKIKRLGLTVSVAIMMISYFIGIIYSLSRSGLLSIISGLMVTAFYLTFKLKIPQKQSVFIAITFCVLVGISIFSLSNTHLLKRITNFSLSESSSSARFELWKNALNGVGDRPFLGWGKENFIYFFVKHYSNKLSSAGDWYDRSHNFLLDKLIEQGILGFISYIILLSTIILLILKQKSILFKQKACFLGFLSSYIFFHMTSFENFISYIILFCMLIYMSQLLRFKEFKIEKKVFLTISISITIVCFYFFVTTARIYLLWNTVLPSMSKKQIYESYNSLMNDAKIGKYDIVLNFDLLKSTALEDSTTSKYYFELAEENTNNLLYYYPNQPVLLSQLGLLQMQSGSLKKAITTYIKLKRIAPNRHINLMDLGMLYAQNNEISKALKIFDEISIMDSSYEPALISKAYCLLLAGDTLGCIQTIDKTSVSSIVESFDKVAEVYEKLNQQEQLLKRIENATSDEKLGVFKPNTFKNWLELAVKLKKKSSIKRSMVECLFVYKVSYNKNEVEKLIAGIQNKNFSTDTFFEKFEGKLLK